MYYAVFFFFSSRRRHTSSYGDWSSDVCSSDLCASTGSREVVHPREPVEAQVERRFRRIGCTVDKKHDVRSEERRVGKECRSRGAQDHEKKKRTETKVKIV